MRAHSEILLRADYRLTIVRGLLIIRNKIIFNGQSIVLTWMISYIVILLLPIAIVVLNEENQILASNSTNTLPSDFPYTQLESSSNFYYTGSDGENMKSSIFSHLDPNMQLSWQLQCPF
jgi:hypothetical protein